MLYIQQSLGPDEEIVYVAGFHWMYTLQAFVSIVWGVSMSIAVIMAAVFIYKQMGWFPDRVGWFTAVQYLHPGVRLLSFLMLMLGFVGFIQRMVTKATTEIAVTNVRIVFKQGLIARRVGEIGIDRIEGINVVQTILGRLLDYGRLAIRGMGVGEVVMPPVSEPVQFRKAIEKARAV